MKKLTVTSFPKYLAAGAPADILFVFHGQERFFMDHLIMDLQKYLFKEQADREVNCHTFYGTENIMADVISACMSYSMFGAKQLVILKEFDKIKAAALDILIKYIRKPQKSTVLVLTAEKWGKTRTHQEILAESVSVACNPLREEQMYGWLQARLKSAGIGAEREGILFLLENTGNDLLRLSMEIDKILDYTGPGGKLTLDLAEKLTGFSREVNIFNFQKYLAGKNFERSMKIGLQLLEQGEALAGILPMLYGFFRKIWMVKTLRSQKLNNEQILQKLDGKMYFYRDIFAAEQKFDMGRLQQVMEQLLNGEIRLKTSQATPESILTMLCYTICTG